MLLTDLNQYDELRETAVTDAAITEAEEAYTKNGELFDAREELRKLREKHLG